MSDSRSPVIERSPAGPGDDRFAFGANWARFLARLDESRIASACESLEGMLGAGNLAGRSFLDIGSGSGLFSLAAQRLGASRIVSMDRDAECVACTRQVKERWGKNEGEWTIVAGDVLDAEFLDGLGPFDVVYSWGVLHHTGAMWRAFELARRRVAAGGLLFVSLYNRQPRMTPIWTAIKRRVQRLPRWAQALLAGAYLGCKEPLLVGRELLSGRDPRRRYRGQGHRGMSVYHDAVDWLGGYPFEAARPDEVVERGAQLGLTLERARLIGRGYGCNEFVFRAAGP